MGYFLKILELSTGTTTIRTGRRGVGGSLAHRPTAAPDGSLTVAIKRKKEKKKKAITSPKKKQRKKEKTEDARRVGRYRGFASLPAKG